MPNFKWLTNSRLGGNRFDSDVKTRELQNLTCEKVDGEAVFHKKLNDDCTIDVLVWAFWHFLPLFVIIKLQNRKGDGKFDSRRLHL